MKMIGWFALLLMILCLMGCGGNEVYKTEHTVYDRQGHVTDARADADGQVISELRRQFQDSMLTGQGSIRNSNEGLARRAATQLAVSELAAKVETEVRSNTRVYNNSDIRDVVETRVAALVQNYEIDYAGYEADLETYVVKVSLTGRRLVEEFERQLVRR